MTDNNEKTTVENTVEETIVDPFQELATLAISGELDDSRVETPEEPKAEEPKAEEPTEKKEDQPEAVSFEKVDLPEEFKELEGEDKDKKIEDLIAKSENEDLSPEEMTFLDSEGYEILEQKSNEGPVEEPQEPVVENEPTEDKFRKPKYAETIESVFPDKDFLTIEDYEDGLIEFLETEDKTKKQLVDVLEGDPSVQKVFADMVNGKSFRAAILDNIDPELLTKVDKDDPDYEEIIKSKVRKEDELKRAQDAKQKLMDNQRKSLQIADQFSRNQFKNSEGKFDEGKSSKFFSEVDSIIMELNQGIISEKALNMFVKGLDYDGMRQQMEKDAAEREKNAEIRGRNSKIIIQRKSRSTDGPPHPQAPQDKLKEGGKNKFTRPEDKLLWLADNLK